MFTQYLNYINVYVKHQRCILIFVKGCLAKFVACIILIIKLYWTEMIHDT